MLVKRLFDVIVASFALLLLTPILYFVAFFVRKELGSPIVFKQIRPGFNEILFEMIKFRTMKNAYDLKGNILPDKERLTKFGLFLRNTSLDELPELINVIKGEMSLVGPRPLLVKYLPYYTESERQRHMVKPGITGWAQINGRNNLSWAQKLELDLWYVKNRSFLLDLKILFFTIYKVIKREDVVADAGDSVVDFDEERKACLANQFYK